MMMGYCSYCENTVGYAFVAQYKARLDSEKYGEDVLVCQKCWNNGIRMWICDNNCEAYAVTNKCPDGFREAMIYWDEKGYVTHRDISEMTYPSIRQPN